MQLRARCTLSTISSVVGPCTWSRTASDRPLHRRSRPRNAARRPLCSPGAWPSPGRSHGGGTAPGRRWQVRAGLAARLRGGTARPWSADPARETSLCHWSASRRSRERAQSQPPRTRATSPWQPRSTPHCSMRCAFTDTSSTSSFLSLCQHRYSYIRVTDRQMTLYRTTCVTRQSHIKAGYFIGLWWCFTSAFRR